MSVRLALVQEQQTELRPVTARRIDIGTAHRCSGRILLKGNTLHAGRSKQALAQISLGRRASTQRLCQGAGNNIG